ncbi:MAG: trypsin-like peptidase domain-containing protein [Verrucomicrobiota bacterium]
MLRPALAIDPAQEPVVKAVSKARPAVVNIYTETLVEQRVIEPEDIFFERFFGRRMNLGRRVAVPVRSLGSGLIVDPEGYVVTNHHVVARAKNTKIKVTLENQESYEARLIRSIPELDLALIQILPSEEEQARSAKPDFTYLNLEKTSPNLLGQTVIVIGNPIGYESSVSRGILSANNRTVTLEGITYDNLLQTDAAINPGNSGGPLIDINGNLVGISSSKLGMTQGPGGAAIPVENIGFAIPANEVTRFVKDSIDIARGIKEEPRTRDLVAALAEKSGITVQDLSPDLAASFGLPIGNANLLITDVEKGSPADDAGVKQDMLITSINGFRVRTVEDIPYTISRLKKGERIQLTLRVIQQKGNFLLNRNATTSFPAR